MLLIRSQESHIHFCALLHNLWKPRGCESFFNHSYIAIELCYIRLTFPIQMFSGDWRQKRIKGVKQ
jgi:hypothetical protein